MNRMNRKVEYALMSLKYMTQKIPGELTTAKEVCDSLSTPFDATARVMQAMAQHGLLRSEQGATGGYQITRDLSKVSLLELFEMIEGKLGLVRCHHKESHCEIQGNCNIILPINNLNRKYNEFFESVKLKELLVSHG